MRGYKRGSEKGSNCPDAAHTLAFHLCLDAHSPPCVVSLVNTATQQTHTHPRPLPLPLPLSLSITIFLSSFSFLCFFSSPSHFNGRFQRLFQNDTAQIPRGPDLRSSFLVEKRLRLRRRVAFAEEMGADASGRPSIHEDHGA